MIEADNYPDQCSATAWLPTAFAAQRVDKSLGEGNGLLPLLRRAAYSDIRVQAKRWDFVRDGELATRDFRFASEHSPESCRAHLLRLIHDFESCADHKLLWGKFNVHDHRTGDYEVVVRDRSQSHQDGYHSIIGLAFSCEDIDACFKIPIESVQSKTHEPDKIRGGRPALHNHSLAAATVALSLSRLETQERKRLTKASIAEDLRAIYAANSPNQNAPDTKTLEDNAGFVRKALNAFWAEERNQVSPPK
ncbi:MAG: hypothetical protein KBA57_01745 [Sphingomonadaceae bacterium]|nr:hypothetical protein [Sphingomonadaceae bacterium]